MFKDNFETKKLNQTHVAGLLVVAIYFKDYKKYRTTTKIK